MTRKAFIEALASIFKNYYNDERARCEAEAIARDYADAEIESDAEADEILQELEHDIVAELQCAYYLGH